jgi:hypothetical protein
VPLQNGKDSKGSTPLQHLVLGIEERLASRSGACGSSQEPHRLTTEEFSSYTAVLRLMKQHGLNKNIKDSAGTALDRILYPGWQKSNCTPQMLDSQYLSGHEWAG